MHRISIAIGSIFLTLALPMPATAAASLRPANALLARSDDFADDMSVDERERIQRRIQANIQRLGLHEISSAADVLPISLQWPLQPTEAFIGYDYHGVSNFVDHNPKFPGFVQDYTCGSRSYDNASGYNHAGTDYFLWPYAWYMMDTQQVEIVAAAAGTIVEKSDGYFDRSCAMSTSAQWNSVYVLHADGTVAWYGHMKSGSQTAKPVGASVAAGEFLGLVGSSGSSTAPHLHFELHDAVGGILDPRHGQCNVADDRWEVFQPYEQPTINSLSTHGVEPSFVNCGIDADGNAVHEDPHYKNVFMAGDSLWVFASYHDQRDGENTHFRILRPDGSVFVEWDFDQASAGQPKPFYAASAWDWQYTLPNDAEPGAWVVEAEFQGVVSRHPFSVTAAQRRHVIPAARCRPALVAPTPGCQP